MTTTIEIITTHGVIEFITKQGVIDFIASGPRGSIGPQGPPGTPAGHRWYGEGPPGTIVGAAPGDEYLDALTGNLYVLQ